ncbi:Hint domain-containing protein [Pseudooceanicola sp.]|uniref:Hint domain-containing protein n=1 Tax=Pseudooceanicola sp. TaxID=1914328 RepID=UPI00260D91C5|nr:Hint domain-containing protein [Pseudooceanicola sp.]
MPDIDTDESNYTIENKASLLGTYGSDANPLKEDVVTIDSDSPVDDLDLDHHGTGYGTLTYDVGAGPVTTSLDSIVLYETLVTFMDGSMAKVKLDVIQTTNGDVFALPWDGYTILGSQGIKSFKLAGVDSDGYAGIYQSDYDEVQFVCYAEGTLIKTPEGERRVESLTPGDRVNTLDHGPQTVRWTRSHTHPLDGREDATNPVLVKAGALGRNLPAYDLVVSPQHRILVGGGGQLQRVFASEAFVPAKSLTELPGIRRMRRKREITWVHFACDRHEVVTANGGLAESLLLGPLAMTALNAAERQEVTEIFGAALTPDAALNGPPARDCLTVSAVKRNLAKYLKDKGRPERNQISRWDMAPAMKAFEAESLPQPRAEILCGG